MAKLEQLEIEIVAKTTSGASTGVKNLAEALEKLADAGKKLSGLDKVASSLAELVAATKEIGSANSNIRKIGTALKHLISDVEGVGSIADGLEKVAAAIANIASAGSGLTGLGGEIRDITRAASGASSSNGIPSGGTGIVPSGEAGTDAAQPVEELGNAVEVSTEKIARMVEAFGALDSAANSGDISAANEQLKEMTRILSETNAEDVSQAMRELFAALASGNASNISAGLERVRDVMSHLPPTAEETTTKLLTAADAAEMLKIALRGVDSASNMVKTAALKAGKAIISAGWERAKDKVMGFAKGLTGIWASFKRIAMYRALRTAIKAITTGFSEGVKHLYQWAQLTGDSFVQTMDSMATSAHYLKDSLGAMASPLLDVFAPALEILVDRFVALLNVVNQFVSALTGKDTWRKAVRTPTQYSGAMKEATDNTKKATKAQKELNKALQGFDELNVITTSDIKARKPTSSAGDAPEVSATEFETTPIADWIKAIKDEIENGNWYGAGKLLADKLNGMIAEWNAEEWGSKLGEKFQNGISAYLGFMKNTDWGGLGTKIATAINSALKKIDAKDLGDAITAKLESAVEFLKNFSAKIDLSKLGEALGEAFNNLFGKDFLTNLGETVGNFINDAIDFGAAWIATADLSGAGENIIDGITTAITSIDMEGAGTFLADLAIGLIDFLLGALEAAIDNLDEIMGAVMEFVDAFFTKLGDYFHEKFFGWADEVNEWFGEVFGTSEGPHLSANSLVGDFDEPIQGAKELQEALNNLDGTTAEVGATDKDNSLTKTDTKAKTLTNDMDKAKGTRTAKFTVDGVEASKTKVNNHLKRLNSVKGTWKAIVDLTGYNATLNEIQTLQKSLDKLSKGKYKMVIDVVGGGTSNAKVVVNNYMGTGLQAYAEGGWPTEGSMFVAGESGPEIVSTINGKTGVASTKEVTGIATAVYETGENEAALLREQNRILRQLAAKNMSVTLAPNVAAGRWVTQAQTAYARATGG